MNVPQVASLDEAVKMYYEKPMLFTKDIATLFNCKTSTAQKVKFIAAEEMRKREMMFYNSHAVNTPVAYEAWGLDIEDLEKRVEWLKKHKRTKKMNVKDT